MRDRLAQHPRDAVALVDAYGSLPYGALCDELDRVCDLFTRYSLLAGGAFALALSDSCAWAVADLACMSAHIPCVPVPHFFTPAQRAHMLAEAGVTYLISDEGTEGEPLLIAGKPCRITRTPYASKTLPRGTAKITYTSGTTGTPKGVCLSEHSMIAQADALRAALGESAIHIHRSLLPLSVLLENVAGLYVALLSGAQVHLGAVPLTADALAEALMVSSATSCILVPALLQQLVASGRHFPALRFVAVGGASVPPALITRARAQGIPVYEGYGLSEACSVVALNTPQHDKAATCGKPLIPTTLSIAADGEIMLHQPAFLGYLGEPAPTRPYPTGDIGTLDAEGYLRITGRKKHIIITAYGRNFSPEWVESELCASGVIAQAVVYGDARPFNCAVVVAADEAAAHTALQQANARLPDYAQVRHLVFASAPFTPERGEMTATGKPHRAAIQQHYALALQAPYERNVA